jgi:hypothetical protein
MLVPAAWAGTTYYAAPLTANITTCDQANPCTLVAAIGKTLAGDTVQLAPGDYHHAGGVGTSLNIPALRTIQGQPEHPGPGSCRKTPIPAARAQWSLRTAM